MVIRPKSMATVVVVLPCTREASSLDCAITVISASVPATGISLTAATKVLLPTPNAPAITIFADRASAPSEVVEATQHPLQQIAFGNLGGLRVNADPAGRSQVADQDTDHTQRQAQA